MLCWVWWNPRAKREYRKPEAKHTQTPKNCFRLFHPGFSLCSVFIIPAEARWNDDKSTGRKDERKKYHSHCLIVLLLIWLPFINHYRFRCYGSATGLFSLFSGSFRGLARYKLISYSDDAVRLLFCALPFIEGMGFMNTTLFGDKLKS